MREIKIIHENESCEIFEVSLNGSPVIFCRDKQTDDIRVDVESALRAIGRRSLNDVLASDAGLDGINSFKKDNPDKAVFGELGSGAMFEEVNINK